MEVAETGAGQDVVKTTSSASESSTEVSRRAKYFHKFRIKRDHLYSNVVKENIYAYSMEKAAINDSNEYFYFD